MDNPEVLPKQVDASSSGSAQAGRQIARAAGIVMIAYVSAIAKSGEPNPSVMPIAVARPETVAEWRIPRSTPKWLPGGVTAR